MAMVPVPARLLVVPAPCHTSLSIPALGKSQSSQDFGLGTYDGGGTPGLDRQARALAPPLAPALAAPELVASASRRASLQTPWPLATAVAAAAAAPPPEQRWGSRSPPPQRLGVAPAVRALPLLPPPPAAVSAAAAEAAGPHCASAPPQLAACAAPAALPARGATSRSAAPRARGSCRSPCAAPAPGSPWCAHRCCCLRRHRHPRRPLPALPER
jgi:hypothetical protein